MEQNSNSPKLIQKKIMIIALCLSLFLFILGCFCAINEVSRPTTYGIILGLLFSWLSLFILWALLIYDSKWKIEISFLSGILLWIIRTFFLLIVLLIIVFVFLTGSKSISYTLQILLFALFAYSIPIFTVFIFWIEEIFIKIQKRKK